MASLTADGQLPQLRLPSVQKTCPKADLAVRSVGQTFEGDIATTASPSQKNGFGQDLTVTNLQPVSFSYVVENKGTVDVTNAVTQLTLRTNNYAQIDYRDLQFTCSDETGGAVCPFSWNKSPNTPYTATGTFDGGSYGYISVFGQKSGGEIIPSLPAGSSLKITMTFTPTKFRDGVFEYCGDESYNARLHFENVTIWDDNQNIVDPNEQNNRAEYNTEYGHKMQDIRTTSIGKIFFGTVNRASCPSADVAVTSVSQSMVGTIETEERTSGNGFYKYSIPQTPQPVSFTATYSNVGTSAADDSNVYMSISAGNSSTDIQISYENLQYSCTTTGGAVCPVELVNFNENNNNTKTGRISGSKEFLGYKVPTFPAGSSVTITATFTPKEAWYPFSSCGTSELFPQLWFKNVSVSTKNDVAELDKSNNAYDNFRENDPRSFQRILSGNIGIIHFGKITQIADVCKRSRVSVDVKLADGMPNYLMENQDFAVEYILKNTGDVDVANVRFNGKKANRVANSYRQSAKISYRDFEVSCTTTGTATCPDAQPNGNEIPYNGTISQSAGDWNYSSSNDWQGTNTFFATTIPLLPANSEIKMTVRYKLSNVRDVIGYEESDRWISWEKFLVDAALDENRFTSNDGSLSDSEEGNIVYFNDVYINNKFVAKNPNDGNCENPQLIAREGQSEMRPGQNMCSYIEIGNAGRANAIRTPFAATIPHGLAVVDASNIKCVVFSNGDGETQCGGNFYFDAEKRQIIGTIDRIANGGRVFIVIPGKTVDYSSTWKSIAVLPKQSGFYERIPETNTSEQNYSIQGEGPSIQKSSSVRTATVNDEFTYTIIAKNSNSNAEVLNNAKILDKLDNSFIYVGTEDIIFTGGATISQTEKPSLVENIGGNSVTLDENLRANYRPTRLADGTLEW